MVFQCHFQQYFSYIVVVCFIGGGNRSTWRKPPTCRKSDKLCHVMLYQVHFAINRILITTLVMIGTDCTGRSNYHTITTTTAAYYKTKVVLRPTKIIRVYQNKNKNCRKKYLLK